MSIDMQKNSETSEQPGSLNSRDNGTDILSKLSNLKTRREFIGLLGIAGASLFLERFSKEVSFNPNKTEAKALALDPIIDLTAPTFVTECADAHLRPDATLGERINVTNCVLIGVFVGFPDQPQGLADLQAGAYSTAYLNNLPLVHDFYDHFTGITMTLDTLPPIITEHPWAYYNTDYENKIWTGDIIFDELLARGLLAEHYDGHTYPIYQIFDAQDPSSPQRMGAGGRLFHDGTRGYFGDNVMQGNMLINNDYNFKSVVIHETGHAISLPDRHDNTKSAMYQGWPDGNPPKLLDQIDISQLIVPLPYQSFLPLMFKN